MTPFSARVLPNGPRGETTRRTLPKTAAYAGPCVQLGCRLSFQRCAGAVRRNLEAEGFPRVYNKNEDFYVVQHEVIQCIMRIYGACVSCGLSCADPGNWTLLRAGSHGMAPACRGECRNMT
jgi:hypothetical protein